MKTHYKAFPKILGTVISYEQAGQLVSWCLEATMNIGAPVCCEKLGFEILTLI